MIITVIVSTRLERWRGHEIVEYILPKDDSALGRLLAGGVGKWASCRLYRSLLRLLDIGPILDPTMRLEARDVHVDDLIDSTNSAAYG